MRSWELKVVKKIFIVSTRVLGEYGYLDTDVSNADGKSSTVMAL